MSSMDQIKSDVQDLVKGYKASPENVKYVDKLILILFSTFFVNFLIILVFNIKSTPANMAFVFFPLFLSGIFLSFRNQFANKDSDFKKIYKDFIVIAGVMTLLFLMMIFVSY